MPKITLARRLRVALAEQDLEDQDVALRAHVSAEWLSSVKNGHTKNPATDKLNAVAQVLGKPLVYFTEPLGHVPIIESSDLAHAEAAIMGIKILTTDEKIAVVESLREKFGRKPQP